MPFEVIRQRLRRELRTHGVDVRRMLIDVNRDHVVLSGDIATYYELQLIQLHAPAWCEDRKLVLNLAVVAEAGESTDIVVQTDTQARVNHRLRNRLNEIGLGIRLVDRAMEAGDVETAHAAVRELMRKTNLATAETVETAGIAGVKILVVEDDSQQCLLLTGLLRHLSAQVKHASDAASAYQSLNSGFTPDIVLQDMHLVAESGAEIVQAIRQRRDCNAVKIIAVSGTPPTDVGLEIDAEGVDAWVPKPVNIEHLLLALQKLRP